MSNTGLTLTLQCYGSVFTSSFEKEQEAMKLALNWLADSGHTGKVLICTDSQANWQHLEQCIWSCQYAMLVTTVTDNFAVGAWSLWYSWEWASRSSIKTGYNCPASRVSQCSVTYQAEQPWPRYTTLSDSAVYVDYSEQRQRREVVSRKDSTLLAQLRSGHYVFRHTNIWWKTQSTPTVQDVPTAPAPQMLQHWHSTSTIKNFRYQ